MKPDVKIRAATQEDVPFITWSWLETYRDSEAAQAVRRLGNTPSLRQYVGLLDGGSTPNLYFALQRRMIEKLLREGNTVIACDPDAEHIIWGWACYGTGRADKDGFVNQLHYVCVKEGMQEMGIGRALMLHPGSSVSLAPTTAEMRLEFSHSTKDFEKRMRKDNESWMHRPELMGGR